MELMLAIAVAAVLAAVALPRVRGAAARQAVEGARAHVTGQVIRARAAANERRCAAVVHVTPGSTARVWVTACARGANAVDTIASVAYLSERFGVSVATTADSFTLAPAGLPSRSPELTVTFSLPGATDTLTISPLGKPVR